MTTKNRRSEYLVAAVLVAPFVLIFGWMFIYPTLQMLADEGLVTAEMQEDRKVYSLTDAGRDAQEAALGYAPRSAMVHRDHMVQL